MPRYIDIDKMNKWDRELNGCDGIENCLGKRLSDCRDCYYNNGGAEDVAPVVHSLWECEYCNDEWYGMSYKCGICGESMIGKSNYCPNCGAKMDGELMLYSYEEKIEMYKQMEAVEKFCGDDYWERLEK